MGETDCSKSSHVAILKFELSENPIRDLKSRHRKSLFEAKGPKKAPNSHSEGGSSSTTLICALVCRIVAREQDANSEEPQTAQTSLHQPGTRTTYTLVL